MTFQPPEPFVPHPRKSPLTTPWEPIFADIREDRWVLAVEVREPHTNSRGGQGSRQTGCTDVKQVFEMYDPGDRP